LLEKVLLGQSGIDRRHFAFADPREVFALDAQGLNEAFEREATRLATEAVSQALEEAGVAASALDALFVCTCTGYLCPGISSHVAERLGLRPNAYLQDLVGLGCGAAIPLLRSAHGFLSAQNGPSLVATVAVEICSAAFYVDDEPGVLISLSLFGDGASASIWANQGRAGQWALSGFDTLHDPAAREKIRFVNAGGCLRNKLDRSVPTLAAQAVHTLYQRRESEPEGIVSHTGGRDVIDALEKALGGRKLTESREILRRCGNVSSPSVLLALREYLSASPQRKGPIWAVSFGAGFAAHACELRRLE
jgi:alkylresorcinol/alkylpyrone synthase